MACLLVKDAVWLLPSTPSLVSAPLVAREYRSLHPERGREKRARSGPGVMRGASSPPHLHSNRPRFARIKGESRAGLASIDIFSTMEPGSCLHETVLTETFRQLDKAVFDFEMLAGGTEGDLDAVRDAHTGISDLLVCEFTVNAARGY